MTRSGIIVSLLLGVILFLVSVGMKISFYRKKAICDMETKGIVADNIRYGSESGDTSASTKNWHPVFEFSVMGRTMRKESHVGKSKPQFRVGQQVTVRYYSDNPEVFYIVEEDRTITTVLLISGSVLIMLSCIFFIKA